MIESFMQPFSAFCTKRVAITVNAKCNYFSYKPYCLIAIFSMKRMSAFWIKCFNMHHCYIEYVMRNLTLLKLNIAFS